MIANILTGESGEQMSYTGAVVIVPTRNRARLAMNAIQSVLEQPVDSVQVMVSDNSTLEHEGQELAAFCANLADPRLRYLRPPEPLAMPPHWQWAIEQALALYQASHFIYLTDRMMFRRGALKEVLDLAALYPEKIISYNLDRICDDAMPIRIEQYPATGKLLEVETERLSRLVSQAIFHPGLPRMLNCIVPRVVLDRLRQRFGNVFSSIAPDFNFCFRCLDIEDSILYFDKAPIFHYALHRSLGASATRGEMTPDNADFTANLPVDNSVRNYATPIPQLITAVNAAFNEYLVHKQATTSQRFFEIDPEKYLWLNATEIKETRDPEVRAEMLNLLAKHGYREETNGSAAPALSRPRASSVLSKLKRTSKKITSGAGTKPAWLFLARRLGVRPPGEVEFEFREIDEAIDYARNISRGNLKSSSFTFEILQGQELPQKPHR